MAMNAESRGEPALYISVLIFSFVNLFVKFAGSYFSGFFVSGVRFAIGAVLAFIVVFMRKSWPQKAQLPDIILRGLFGALAMIATYLAIAIAGPGRATLLSNTYPLFVALFGVLLFKERATWRLAACLGLSLAGAVLVMRDGSSLNPLGDIVALAGAVLAGISVNYLRRASSRGVDPFVIYLAPCLFGLPVLAFSSFPESPPGAAAVAFLLAVGIGAFIAQALMTYGYRTVSASRGSVFFFAETGITVLLGALFAGEKVTVRFGIGLLLIFAGVWLNRGEAARKIPHKE
jgi:drug/metabolite transporter (DMT)-like permease